MNVAELKQDVWFLTNTSSSDYSEAEVLRNLNKHYEEISTIIWHSAGDWNFDDKNYITHPIAETDLVDGQQDYSLPTVARRIERVEVKDKDGNWVKLKKIDEAEIESALPEFFKTPGLPAYYDLRGFYIFLYPSPDKNDVTLSSGLRVYMERSVVKLQDDADEPSFISEFHGLLSIRASLDWCIAKEYSATKISSLMRIQRNLEEKLKQYYSQRHKGKKARIVPKIENYE